MLERKLSHAKAGWEKTRRRDGQAGNPYKGTFLGKRTFSWRSIEMLTSPAYRALSLSARKVLDRLEIEFARHGNNPLENGNLPCTYEHFKEYGIGENQVGPAIKEVVALGFIRATSPGSAGNAGYREAARYLLTYRHAGSDKRIEDGWKRIKTMEEAETIGKSARARVSDSRAREFGIKGAGAHWKNKSPATETVAKPPSKESIPGHRNSGHGAQSPATDSVAPLEYRGGGGRQGHGMAPAVPAEPPKILWTKPVVIKLVGDEARLRRVKTRASADLPSNSKNGAASLTHDELAAPSAASALH
jgi:hypothetical protein